MSRRPTLIIGALGIVLALLGWILDAQRFYGAWLAAVTLLLGWSLGSIAILLTHSLTGGRWGDVLRPALRLGVCSLPLLLPALLPLLIGLAPLYPWARPEHLDNRFYLNVPFFELRLAIYLIVWFALAWLVLRGGRAMARFAPAGLFLLAITSTFAAIDTTMSLDPHFVSSVYGMITAAGSCLLALSMATLLTTADIEPDRRADLGKLLLALAILWIYVDFMQLLIVWQSDLASEAPWYLARSRGFWGALQIVLVLGHFVLPFFLLLSPKLQRSPPILFGVAGLMVAMEVLRCWWTVLPSLGWTIGWLDIACVAGIGGLALASARALASRPLFAPAFTEARHG